MEAQKAEQRKLEMAKERNSKTDIQKEENAKPSEDKDLKRPVEKEIVKENKSTENIDSVPKNCDKEKGESSSQRRIRNKDRPTIAIYRPGMLSKRKQVENEPENKESKS